MKRLCCVVLAAGAVLAGCAAPADLDGEVGGPAGQLWGRPRPPPRARSPRPSWSTPTSGPTTWSRWRSCSGTRTSTCEAVTIAATGLVGCDPGVDARGGLFEQPRGARGAGRVRARHGRPAARAALPAAWRAAAAAGSGLTPVAGAVTPAPEPAPQLIAEHSPGGIEDLVVVALGPMTNLADLATQHADDYARLAAVQAMGGSVAGRSSTASPSGTPLRILSRSRRSWLPRCP